MKSISVAFSSSLWLLNLILTTEISLIQMQQVQMNAYLIIYPFDGRNIHVVGGGAHIFILLVSEDVNTNQVNLKEGKCTNHMCLKQ